MHTSTQGVQGDPFNESRLLVALQTALADKPGVLPIARGMSHFGEHALGWFATAAAGWMLNSIPKDLKGSRTAQEVQDRRRDWAAVGASAFVAHGASVVAKRIVRRPRPHHPDVRIGVSTPSSLSFPSSHATSSSAALVAMALMWKNPAPLLGIPAMALSRMVLGVHYPSDVTIGSAIGSASACAVRAVCVKST